jgi:hypothetical protein
MLSHEDKIDHLTKLVATIPSAQLKGDTIPYCSMNGHMYCYLSKEGVLALRLPRISARNFLNNTVLP